MSSLTMMQLIALCKQGDRLIEPDEEDKIIFTSRHLVIPGHDTGDSYRDDLKIVIEDDGEMSLFYRRPNTDDAWSGGWRFINYEELCGKAYCI